MVYWLDNETSNIYLVKSIRYIDNCIRVECEGYEFIKAYPEDVVKLFKRNIIDFIQRGERIFDYHYMERDIL